MNAPVIYIPSFWDTTVANVENMNACIPWEQRETARAECFMSRGGGLAYTYGKAGFARTYTSVPTPALVDAVMAAIDNHVGVTLDVCFANRYDMEKNHVGWHKDDSVDIDQSKPIAVVSLGAAREIWFRCNETGVVDKLMLEDGSLAIMLPGMQSTHMHRIPKHSASCGMRVSLTSRAMKAA